jgi:hypothetical protein
MTRKDYVNIAAAIRLTQDRIDEQMRAPAHASIVKQREVYANRQEQLRGVRRAAAHLADALKADNPKGFDPAIFLTNCGYGASPQEGR